ncbi:MAG TPA: FlgD immunoglobulin-like domain containing protein, partial [Candidatus Krumholzibacteria bacterium]|nr:FlgD immunoglobulin-like domain containing protein [Candidatus Krumholzibacteria bacterium]
DGAPDLAIPYQEGVAYGTNTCPATACAVSTSAPSATRSGLERVEIHPNPFNPRTQVSFDLARSAAVSISIHDAAGRRVRTLLPEATFTAGRHQVVWTGRDDEGRPVASGVYHYHVAVDGEIAAAGRVTLAK